MNPHKNPFDCSCARRGDGVVKFVQSISDLMFVESYFVLNELTSDEEGGEDAFVSDRVGLQLLVQLPRLSRASDEPDDELGERIDQHEDREPLRSVGSGVTQTEPGTCVLHVTKAFFDLHSLTVDANDFLRCCAGVWQRAGD